MAARIDPIAAQRGRRAALLATLGLVTAAGCGRSSPYYDDHEGVASGFTSSAELTSEDGDTDPGNEGTIEPPGVGIPCQGTEIFADGFENRADNWQLGSHFTVLPDVNAFEGGTVLLGDWDGFDTGCPVASSAELTVDLDLSAATRAIVQFSHTGAACDLDALSVSAVVDGVSTTLSEPTPTEGWTQYTADLGAWVGRDDVRLTLAFSNTCGDACGVSWKIDDLRVCADR